MTDSPRLSAPSKPFMPMPLSGRSMKEPHSLESEETMSWMASWVHVVLQFAHE